MCALLLVRRSCTTELLTVFQARLPPSILASPLSCPLLCLLHSLQHACMGGREHVGWIAATVQGKLGQEYQRRHGCRHLLLLWLAPLALPCMSETFGDGGTDCGNRAGDGVAAEVPEHPRQNRFLLAFFGCICKHSIRVHVGAEYDILGRDG